MCVQEKKRLKHVKPLSVHMATHDKENNKRGNNAHKPKKDNKLSIKKNVKQDACFLYKKSGHMKKDCQKYKRWLKKKGYHISSLSWWINSGSTIHIVNTIKWVYQHKETNKS